MDIQKLPDEHLLTTQANLLALAADGIIPADDAGYPQLVEAHREAFQEGLRRGIISRRTILEQLNPVTP